LRCSADPKRTLNPPRPKAGKYPVGSYLTRSIVTLFASPATFVLLFLSMAQLPCPPPLEAAVVPVRFIEGVTRGFLLLRTINGVLIAQGDLFQVVRGAEVESRMIFRFKDGSVFDETAIFTQQGVFSMQKYRLVHHGPVFREDTEISMERASGKYRVKTKARQGGREELLDGTLDLPPDVYNGMVLTVAKNLPPGGSETVHMVAFTPAPRLIQLEMTPAGEQKVLVGELAKTAVHYVVKPKFGVWLQLFATLLGRVPADNHIWIITDGVPAFARFEGSLYVTGPVWLVELEVPRWPE